MKKWGNMRPTSSTPLYVVVVRYFLDFFTFFGKTTHYGKIFKILFRKFSLRHQSTCLPGKNRLALQLLLICNSQPRECTQSAQVSPKLFHFWGSYSWTHEHRQNAPQSGSNIRLNSSFEPNNKRCFNYQFLRWYEFVVWLSKIFCFFITLAHCVTVQNFIALG